MSDDLGATLGELRDGRRVHVPSDEGWGRLTTIEVPGGGTLGLYEPRHPTAI